MEKNLRPWPEDWMLHLMRAFKSYFYTGDDNLEISLNCISPLTSIFVATNRVIDASSLGIFLSLKDIFYIVSINIGVLDISRRTDYRVATYTYAGKTPINILKYVEDEIWKDYWGNNGGNDEEPISPVSPIDSELIFA